MPIKCIMSMQHHWPLDRWNLIIINFNKLHFQRNNRNCYFSCQQTHVMHKKQGYYYLSQFAFEENETMILRSGEQPKTRQASIQFLKAFWREECQTA